MNTRKILSGGRVTIPAELRKKYEIKVGTKKYCLKRRLGRIYKTISFTIISSASNASLVTISIFSKLK